MDEKVLDTAAEVQEDVEVGVKSTTLHFPVRVKMLASADAEFDYTASVDELGHIVLTPKTKDVEFTSAETEWENQDYMMDTDDQLSSGDDSKEKTFTIELTADMLCENENQHINADIDEIGQCVIYPVEKENSFLSVSIDNSLNLATEAETVTIEEDVDQDPIAVDETTEKPADGDVEAEVIEEAAVDRKILFKNAVTDFSNILDQAYKKAEELVAFCDEFKLDRSYADILNNFISNTFDDDFQPHHLLMELGDSELEEAVTPVDDEEPYDFDAVKYELRQITDNFTDEDGVVKCGFECEKDDSLKILSRYYQNIDVEETNGWYVIKFSGHKKHLFEAEDAKEVVAKVKEAVSDFVFASENLAELANDLADVFDSNNFDDNIVKELKQLSKMPMGPELTAQEIESAYKVFIDDNALTEDIDEGRRQELIWKMQNGDLAIYSDDTEPTPDMELLIKGEEYDYYYDPQSDVIVSYLVKN